MGEHTTVEAAGYIVYSDLIDRLCTAYPHVPRWRLEQIATAENDAITGGLLHIVPAEVEEGVIEMLDSETAQTSDDDEVA